MISIKIEIQLFVNLIDLVQTTMMVLAIGWLLSVSCSVSTQQQQQQSKIFNELHHIIYKKLYWTGHFWYYKVNRSQKGIIEQETSSIPDIGSNILLSLLIRQRKYSCCQVGFLLIIYDFWCHLCDHASTVNNTAFLFIFVKLMPRNVVELVNWWQRRWQS